MELAEEVYTIATNHQKPQKCSQQTVVRAGSTYTNSKLNLICEPPVQSFLIS